MLFEGIDLANATITHNHPIENGDVLSFGEDDIYFLKTNPNIKELIAVNTEYTYSIKVLKSLDDVSYNSYYMEAIMQRDPTLEEIVDYQHETCVLLEKKGYIQYERKKYK